jgi:hypothetical protein
MGSSGENGEKRGILTEGLSTLKKGDDVGSLGFKVPGSTAGRIYTKKTGGESS